MGRSTRRGPWLPEEDATLLQLVHLQGPNNWVRISQHMQHRSPKQCRERYHQNLKPSLNHEPVSAEEGEVIEQLVQEMGKRWAEIARRLGNRSDNAVKNWWNGSMNRRKRSSMQPSSGPRLVGPRSQPIPAGGMSRPELFYSHPPQVAQDHNVGQTRGSNSDLTGRGFQDTSAHDLVYQPLHNDTDRRLEIHPLERTSLFSPPQLPSLDTRQFSHSNHAYSAPSSLQVTPNESSTLSLHPLQNYHAARSSPLHSRPSSQTEWTLPRIQNLEASAISPAATECSSAPSLQQAPPSLISDNQSHYSISPKTVSSPRPGMPAAIDTSHYWSGSHRSLGSLPTPGPSKFFHGDEGYVSALPSSSTETKHLLFPIDPILKRDRALPSPTERDTRMNVASLLK